MSSVLTKNSREIWLDVRRPEEVASHAGPKSADTPRREMPALTRLTRYLVSALPCVQIPPGQSLLMAASATCLSV